MGVHEPETEQKVLQVIRLQLKAVLGARELDVDTNLWDVGMDSITCVAVMVAVEEALDVEFPDESLTREVFTSARSIARAVRQATVRPATVGDM